MERRNATYQFDNGQTEQAMVTNKYRVFVKGFYWRASNQAVVKSTCPMLLSKVVMADWDTDLRIGRNAFTCKHLGVTLPCTEDKVLVLDIT